MSINFSRTARLAAAVALPLTFIAANPFTDGMTYEFQMKSQSTRSGNKEQVTMRGRGTYAGDEAKLEILEGMSGPNGQSTFGGKGTYFILKGGGKEMFLVDPTKKQYMAWDMASMLSGASKMAGAMGGMVKMQMTDVHIAMQDMGGGETIQGYPTHHVRMTQNYTVSVSVFGRGSKTKTQTTSDSYIASSLKIVNPFVSNSQSTAASSMADMFNNPDYKTQMTAAMAKMPKGGIPLKTVTTTVTTDDKGKSETTVSTMEMTNFTKTDIPRSAFAIPKDYALIQMPTMGTISGSDGGAEVTARDGKSAGPALNADSVAAAAKAGAAEGAKDAVKQGVKDATSKKIRGIFKH